MDLKVYSKFNPMGDQPEAIDKISKNIQNGVKRQVLLGVTGSGKTYTVAKIIEKINRPALIIAPNKTLAAQLYNEYKNFFPENAVEYFVSYYDYYQPEAYIPSTDTYIEKDSSINEQIDKLRHSATAALLNRRDVIIVASVSAIYGLGSKVAYANNSIPIDSLVGISREKLIKRLIDLRYERNDFVLERSKFRIKGDIIDVVPPYQDTAYRFSYFDDQLEKITEINSITGKKIRDVKRVTIMPATHYLSTIDNNDMFFQIKEELKDRIEFFESQNLLLEAQRIKQRTEYDMEMIKEIGYCKGIENYSRYLTGKASGMAPDTLIEYFPSDFVTFIDESHITVPQIGGMYNGDHSRKKVLIDNGFRLPSAYDNRPLTIDEFFSKIPQLVYISATPSDYELNDSNSNITELLIRPTGIVEPEIKIVKTENQIEDLLEEIKKCVEKKQRVLITTLTKKMSEELTNYYLEKGIKIGYMHSDIDALERVEIIRALRSGVIDVLVGINLLREGLDMPEVSLVAILDADKKGFLRSRRSLIQIMGRAARNVNGRVLLFADSMTDAMQEAIKEVERRKEYQKKYNLDNNITPRNANNSEFDSLSETENIEKLSQEYKFKSSKDIEKTISKLKKEMQIYKKNLEFEKAIELRDKIKELNNILMEVMDE